MLAKKLPIYIVFFLLPVWVYAFDKTPVRYLGIEQGLSNNAVTSIYQDHNGFMWFGTYDGLNRYDGYGFKVFRNIIGDENSVRDNHVGDIESDAMHRLWVGCEKGVSVYDPVTSRFSSVHFRPFGEGMVRTLGSGIHAIQKIDNGRTLLVASDKDGLLLFQNESLEGLQIPLIGKKEKEKFYSVTAIAYNSASAAVWVFVTDVGLCRYDKKNKTLSVVDQAIKKADCIQFDSKGTLWLGNEDGLFRYDEKSKTFSANILPVKYKVVNLYEDKQQVLWIASDGGGLWSMPLASQKPSAFLDDDGKPQINSNAVYAIYEDNQGGKWIGTLRGGVNLIQPRTSPFKLITQPSSNQNNLVGNFILSFSEDEKSNIWIGTDGSGLRYWDRQKKTFSEYLHNPGNQGSISSNFITNILPDSQGDIWMATWFGGINRLKKGAKSFERFTLFNSSTNHTENNAWLVYEDAQRTIWASTTNNGTLYRFNRTTNRFDLFDPSIVNVQCLAEDKEGHLWAGNYSTLLLIDTLLKKHRSYHIGYTVRAIHEDRNGNFWIGTDGGGLLLFNRANGRYQRFTTSNGLPSNIVLRLLEDRHNNLWLSTYNGLSKFNPHEKTFRNFSYSDGLQSNQFSFNAALALRSGEFLFGGIKGFNIFYPDSVYDKKETPGLFLTGLRVNNQPIEENPSFITNRNLEKIETITLPYGETILSLEFVALDYSGADKLKYAYQLSGWDKAWNYVNNVRTANYSRLDEGNYTFKIKVTNAAGAWSNETKLLTIVVLPPWYRTWWAYILYAFVLSSVIYLYLRYNRRQERLKYEIKLARLEKEKEKELTEKKISFFTHISHEFRTPLTLIINPLKELMHASSGSDSKAMATIYRNARRLLSLVDQLLLFRKVESVDQQLRIEKFDIVEACREVYLSFGQHALSKNIEFSFEQAGNPIIVYGDKEKIEIILFNLVSNAFKYTDQNGTVVLRVSEKNSGVAIDVRDTGCGIPPEIGTSLFESFYRVDSQKTAVTGFGVGLFVSRKLALAHHGELSYTSDQESGTSFTLFLRKGKEHFGTQYISEDYQAGKTILQELVEEPVSPPATMRQNKAEIIDKLRSELPVMVLVDDNAEMRSYVRQVFEDTFIIYEAEDGATGYELVQKEVPDIVISDVKMKRVSGIELCRQVKANPVIAHIPVILLTASSSDNIKLQGIEGGAEDYILKPFEKELIIARVQNILKAKTRMQQYFFNAATLKPASNLPGEHKLFIEKCMAVVEAHLDDPEFTIQTFCKEIGMSHPSLYKKVKTVSGLTVNVFIRYIRLRKAAELLITTDKTIVEVTYLTGFNDVRYFREQFQKLFEMNPSDYIKRYRRVLGGKPVGE